MPPIFLPFYTPTYPRPGLHHPILHVHAHFGFKLQPILKSVVTYLIGARVQLLLLKLRIKIRINFWHAYYVTRPHFVYSNSVFPNLSFHYCPPQEKNEMKFKLISL